MKVFSVWVKYKDNPDLDPDQEWYYLIVTPREDMITDFIHEQLPGLGPEDWYVDDVYMSEHSILDSVIRVTKPTILTSFSYKL